MFSFKLYIYFDVSRILSRYMVAHFTTLQYKIKS